MVIDRKVLATWQSVSEWFKEFRTMQREYWLYCYPDDSFTEYEH